MKYQARPNIVDARQLTSNRDEMVKIVEWAREGKQNAEIIPRINAHTLQNSIEFRVSDNLRLAAAEEDWVVKESDGVSFPMTNTEFISAYMKVKKVKQKKTTHCKNCDTITDNGAFCRKCDGDAP